LYVVTLAETRLFERLYFRLPVAEPGSAVAFMTATLFTAAAIIIRFAVDPWVSQLHFVLSYTAVTFSALFCGVAAGLYSIVLSVVLVWYFLVEPRFSFGFANPLDAHDIVGFVIVALVDVMVVGLLRSSVGHLVSIGGLDIAIFESNPDAILVVRDDGRIMRVNDRAITMFGYPRKSLLEQPIEKLIPGPWPKHLARRRGRTADNRTSKAIIEPDLIGQRADGSEFPVDRQIGPVRYRGEPCMIVNVRDMTEIRTAAIALAESRKQQAILEERQRTGDALQQTASRLSGIIQAAPVAIWALDRNDRITMWNPGVERIYGVAAADIVGLSWRDAIHDQIPEGAVGSDYLVRTALENDGFTNLEVKRKGVDGTIQELSVSASVLRDSAGEFSELLFVASDVGETRQLEARLRQAQKMEAVGQLTGGVAHDFNNLLAVIYGNLELLERHGKDDPQVQELVDDALKAAARGANLTHQLLAYSRRQPLSPKEADVGALVVDLVSMLRRVVEESIEIVTSVYPGLWKVRIDTEQLSNALLNLAINGRDAMSTGGRLTISAENKILDQDYCSANPEVIPGPYVKLSVADTGTGMAQGVLERAMEPFFTTKAVGRGSGLGLSMVYGFIKQSDGHMTITSEPGRGTTVNLFLPRFEEPRTASVTNEARPLPEAGDGQVIMVVEDDASVRKLQVRTLNALGYRTLEADDGTGGLAALRQGAHIDLLLTDMVLPGGISGPELACEMKRLKPDIKVIFMSGYVPDVDTYPTVPHARRLTKPFTRMMLAREIHEALEGD
jgi:PAS domain S-box-containing protein